MWLLELGCGPAHDLIKFHGRSLGEAYARENEAPRSMLGGKGLGAFESYASLHEVFALKTA